MEFPNFIRIATVPFIEIEVINENTAIKTESLDSSESELVKIMAKYLKFSFEYVIPSDKEWGSLLPDGNWSGMVGLLHRNEADLAICMLSITEERSHVIDYSYPYVIDLLVFITRPLEKSIDKKSFLKPFSTNVWIYLCATIIILPVLHMILFRRKSTSRRFKNAYRNLLRHSANAPERMGNYFLRAPWLVFVTIIRWSYAAVLLSFLTFPSLTGVQKIPELANAFRRGEYQCTAYPGSYIADSLLESEDPHLRILGECVEKNEGDTDLDVALSNNTLSNRLAYIGRESRFVEAEKKYFVSQDGFFPDYLAVGVRKGFCCKDQLDTTIHNILAGGIYGKLQKDYYRKQTYKMLSNPLNKAKADGQWSLSLSELQGVFMLLATGYSLAILVLLFELASRKKKIV